jgi:hypothetical protein
MNLFRSYTFTWWQMGILKLALLSIGAAIGAYWNSFFGANLAALIVIALVASAYILYVAFGQ